MFAAYEIPRVPAQAVELSLVSATQPFGSGRRLETRAGENSRDGPIIEPADPAADPSLCTSLVNNNRCMIRSRLSNHRARPILPRSTFVSTAALGAGNQKKCSAERRQGNDEFGSGWLHENTSGKSLPTALGVPMKPSSKM